MNICEANAGRYSATVAYETSRGPVRRGHFTGSYAEVLHWLARRDHVTSAEIGHVIAETPAPGSLNGSRKGRHAR